MALRDWLRRTLVPAPARQVVVLRDLDVARRFPAQPPLETLARRRSDAPSCPRCRGPMREVVVTTGGPGGEPAVWAAHPLSVDGWLCPSCSEVTLPRALEPDEVADLLEQAILASRAGQLDDAELALRRVTSSWPRYAPGRVQLAFLIGQRLARADVAEAADDVIARLTGEMVRQLDDALRGEHQPPVSHVLGLLARALLRKNDVEGALVRVDRVLLRSDIDDEERDALVGLRRWIEARGDLLDDGLALLDPVLDNADAHVPFPQELRRARRGVNLLLRHLDAYPDDAVALRVAARGLELLGDLAGARDLLARVHRSAPPALAGLLGDA
jgi:hypothetical protein